MATHDYSIANQSFPATRSDINNALAAIQSSNSAATAPSGTSSTVIGELFYDTTNNKLRVATDTNGTFVDVALNSSGDLTVSNNLSTSGTLGVTGTATFSGGANVTGAMYATGNIGLDSTDFISFTDNTRMDVPINGSNEFRFESDGDFHADGDIIAYSTTTASDEKLKTGIHTVTNAIDKVSNLKGVEFTWKKDGKRSAGVIAQNVEQVLPEAVKEVKGLDTSEDYKAVNYSALHALYIEAIKELKDIVDEQAKEIQELKKG